jgi:hypothetical protein
LSVPRPNYLGLNIDVDGIYTVIDVGGIYMRPARPLVNRLRVFVTLFL